MISELKEDILKLLNDISSGISNSKTTSELENIRINSLGKKGSITLYLKNIKDFDIETKKEIGAYLNDIKSQINELILDKKVFFKKENLKDKLNSEKIDISLTPYEAEIGTLHPLSRTIEELCAIFADMGFSIVDGPDIESDYYNFTALNIPEEHPARQSGGHPRRGPNERRRSGSRPFAQPSSSQPSQQPRMRELAPEPRGVEAQERGQRDHRGVGLDPGSVGGGALDPQRGPRPQ